MCFSQNHLRTVNTEKFRGTPFEPFLTPLSDPGTFVKEKPPSKTMSALEPASCRAGVSSTSSTSSSIPTAWIADAFKLKGISAPRQSLRGMDVKLVYVVFQSLPTRPLIDWLRLPREKAAVAGN